MLSAITKNCEEQVQLGDEDMALLKSITPPDPMDDWKRIMVILGEEVGFLKTIFRVYCLEGRTGTHSEEDISQSHSSPSIRSCFGPPIV